MNFITCLLHNCRQSRELVELVGQHCRRLGHGQQEEIITDQSLCLQNVSQLPNLFIGTRRICNFILLLIVWVCSFSKLLPSVKLAVDKVPIFLIFREKMLHYCNSKSSPNPHPNFQSRLIR